MPFDTKDGFLQKQQSFATLNPKLVGFKIKNPREFLVGRVACDEVIGTLVSDGGAIWH